MENQFREMRAVFRAMPDAAILILPDNPVFTIQDVNDAYLTNSGALREDIIGKPIAEVFADRTSNSQKGSGLKDSITSLKKVVATKEAAETPGYHRDMFDPSTESTRGRYWKSKYSPVVDENGGLIYILNTVKESTAEAKYKKRFQSDIAEKHKKESRIVENQFYGSMKDVPEKVQLQQQVKREKEFSDALIANLPDIFFLFGKTGKILRWNRNLERISGYSSGEISKMPPIDFIAEEDKQNVQRAISQAFVDGRSTIEADLEKKNGEKISFQFTGNRIEFDGEEYAIGFGLNISERKKAELNLFDSRNRYQSLVESVNGIVWEARADCYEFLFVSENSRDILGFEPEDWYYDTTFWSNLIHPEDRESTLEYFRKMAEYERNYTLEYRMQAANGQIVWVRDIVTYVKRQNEPDLLRGVIFDITKEKKAEQRLEERTHFIETSLENLPIGIALSRINDGKTVLLNRAFIDKYGWPAHKLNSIDHFFNNVYPDESNREQIRSRVVADIESGDPERMKWDGVEITTSKGEKRYVSARNIPLPEQNLMISTVRDVTEEKIAKQKLKKSESRLQGIIESQTNYVIRTDLEGYYTYYNPKFRNEFAWIHENKELVGLHGMESIMEYHHERVREVVEACLENPGEVFQVEIDKPGKNDTVKTTLWDFVCITDSEGNPSEIQCVGIDITEKKASEMKLRASLEEKEVLLSEIHHRVKNNLAIVSSMMQLQAFQESNEEVEKRLYDSIFRISTIATIHEILYRSGSFSKMGFNEIIRKLIHNIDKVLNPEKEIVNQIEQTSIQLNINQAIPCAIIINEVITNIYKHAFTDRENGRIEVQIYEENEKITLTIRDNGIGLPESFEDGSKETLGLQLVDILTDQLKGESRFEQLNPGTSFTLTFKKADVSGIGNASL